MGAVADESGCDKFAWSVARERGWFAAADKLTVATGGTLATVPAAAVVMSLQPSGAVAFVRPPERMPRSADSFGGVVSFDRIEPAGLYQLTLSEDAWVDVIQDERYARSAGSSGRRDCPAVRKSARLHLAASPIVVQVSGVASNTITLSISLAAEGK